MSNAGELGTALYEAETTFGEDVTTFATHRLPILDGIDCSGLKHDKIDPLRVNQYLQGGTQWILGPQEGSFKMRLWLTGHGASTSGALTVDAVETFLSFLFGKITASAASGTTATGGTATVPTTTASGTFAAGSLCRIGTAGDARGNGQAAAIATHVTTTLTLLTGLDAAPNNADVIYTGENLYLPESATDAATSITGLRFLVMTANNKYELHGCWPMSMKFGGLNPAEVPFVEFEFGVSWWRYSTAGTFPSAVTSNQYNPAPNTQGSMFLAAVGTATRAKRTYRTVEIDVELGVVPLPGPGGANAYQRYVGAKRVPSKISIKWTEDAEAASATPTLDGFFTGTTAYHMLLTLGVANGSSVAFYFPNLCFAAARPIQSVADRINRMAIEAKAYAGATTTSELTLSAMRMLFS